MEIGKSYTREEIMDYKEEHKLRGLSFSTTSLKVGDLEFSKNEDETFTLISTRESRIENLNHVRVAASE